MVYRKSEIPIGLEVGYPVIDYHTGGNKSFVIIPEIRYLTVYLTAGAYIALTVEKLFYQRYLRLYTPFIYNTVCFPFKFKENR